MRKRHLIMKQNLKMNLKNVVFLLALLKMCLLFGQNLDVPKRIVIDVGHGGKDPGAIGINGIKEKDVVLDIALEILRLNETIFDGRLDIYLTRYYDTFISLSDRSRLSKVLNADAFVSLHCNASRARTSGRGIEIFVHNSRQVSLNHKLEQSTALGNLILHESVQKLNFDGRGIKSANFQVLRETIGFCPSLLVEIGFVTNDDEADYFLKPKNIRAMALAILMGLYKYFNIELWKIFL